MTTNSREFIELLAKQTQELTDPEVRYSDVREKHLNQIKLLLKTKFFHGVFKYKDDEFFTKDYLIYQFRDFIENINTFGIYNRSKYIQDIKFPKITFRFNGIYCPKIIIENTDFEAFKTNLGMFYFIQGYNQMYNNFKSKCADKDILVHDMVEFFRIGVEPNLLVNIKNEPV